MFGNVKLDKDLLKKVKMYAKIAGYSSADEFIQHALGPLANGGFHERKVGRRHDRTHGLALLVVTRRVHGDEHWPPKLFGQVANRDGGLGGEHLVIGVHGHDVGIARHGPEAAEALRLAAKW